MIRRQLRLASFDLVGVNWSSKIHWAETNFPACGGISTRPRSATGLPAARPLA